MRPMPYREPPEKETEEQRVYRVQRLYIAFIVGALLGAGVTWKVLRHQVPEECHDTAVQVGDRVLWTSNSCPPGTDGELKGEGHYSTLFCKCRKK